MKKDIKKLLSDQSGISLIEVVVASAISIIIAMGVMQINSNSIKGMRQSTTDAELIVFKNTLRNNLSNGNNCANSFRGNYNFVNGGGTSLILDPAINTDNANTNIPTAAEMPPEYLSIPADARYYEFSNDGTKNPSPVQTFQVSRGSVIIYDENEDGTPAPPAADPSWSFTPDNPMPGTNTWKLVGVRVYEQDTASKQCAMHFLIQRNQGNTNQSFGAIEKSFWMNLSCSLTATGTVQWCSPSDSITPGFWKLVTAGTPSDGITYGAGPVIIAGGKDLELRDGGAIVMDSDQRFKKDEKIITNASKKLEQINGYYYFMRTEEFPERSFSFKKQIGVFAQEVESQFKEIVTTKDDGYKAVDYIKLIPVLIQAHKEQEKKIKSQQKQINALSKRIDNLNKK